MLTVCRFYPRKRLPVLLAAADRLRSRIPSLEVRIVGGGPEEDRLRALCRKRNLEKIVAWRRNLSGADLAREYSQCHLFCLPSVQEGFGIVFLEAMANRKPIVAARAEQHPRWSGTACWRSRTTIGNWPTRLNGFIASRSMRVAGNAGREFVRRFDAPVVGRMFLRERTILWPAEPDRCKTERCALPDNILTARGASEIRIRARLHRLRKNSDSRRVFGEGHDFSRAVRR